jgi:EAL domain-containing protein (putative c-di-GMP-specific phosphodiesterase class I)
LGSGASFAGVSELLLALRDRLPSGLSGLRFAWLDDIRNTFLHVTHTSDTALSCGDLLDMITTGRLETWYQPVIDVGAGTIWGYECLVRGRRNDGQLVMPDALFDVARRENLLPLLDMSCRDVHLLNAAHQVDVGRILINVLPRGLCGHNAPFSIFDSIQRAQVDPKAVVLEIMETECVEESAAIHETLGRFRSHGISIAIDDMGSGFAGLSMFGVIDPDIIKIDRHLIARATQSRLHEEICRSLTELGRRSNKIVLAEGIETHKELALVKELGASLVQGNLFGRPSRFPVRPD